MAPLIHGAVIPAGWAAHHQPVSESAMTARCRVEIPGTAQPIDTDTGYRPEATPTVLYEGKARLMTPLRPSKANQAEQDTSTQPYTVAIPVAAAEIPYGATVIFTAATSDVPLIGKRLFVESSAVSFENFEQVLTVIESAESRGDVVDP